MEVEWVSGMAPTAYFLNEEGKTVKEIEVGDKNLEELSVLFKENEFTPIVRKIAFPDEPSARVTVGTHVYELYKVPCNFEDARQFAESKTHDGEAGYMLTITSPEEAEYLSLWLGANQIATVWIGAQDAQSEGEWKWIGGPEKDQVFWSGDADGKSKNNMFANWNDGEPNNAGDEDCGVFSVTGRMNDAVCKIGGPKLSVVIEYGSGVVEPSVYTAAREKKEEL
jgi:hypothetical protein